MRRIFIILSFLPVLLVSACKHNLMRKDDPFRNENLVAWCIVPFDAQNRTPEERAAMLRDLGISQLAYDYRDEHLPSFKHELQVLREGHIRLRAVWLWVDGADSSLFNPSNEFIFNTLRDEKVSTELWLSFPESYFDGLDEAGKLAKAEKAIRAVQSRAAESGSTVALYNHGGWFGEPENQIRLIRNIDPEHLRIVYNFHHGHLQTERFPELFERMLPYLSAVNINGMKKEGPKIIPVGEGDLEYAMLKKVYDSGFTGTIGILGHTEGQDIKPVLEKNMEGLQDLARKIRKSEN
ncbi:MAG: sugar phosphate isomerase/epimerase family protein [Bacteroidota bacterium]